MNGNLISAGTLFCLVAAAISSDWPTKVEAGTSAENFPAPRLVEDISRDHVPGLPQPPIAFTELEGVHYFFADDGVHASELWRTDGSSEGTWMVRDICPGDCASASASTMVVHDALLFFFADDGAHGDELWASDGSESGTYLVADIASGFQKSYCQSKLTSLDNWLIFAASDGEHGCELWRSDGSAEGTVLVADTHPGDTDPWNGPRGIVRLDGSTAMFASGDALWRTDGIPSGTQLVADVQVAATQTGPFDAENPQVVDGKLYFSGTDETDNWEPWTSDGTPSGTFRLADIEPGSIDSSPRGFVGYHGLVYFIARSSWERKLYRTDGTQAGTELFADSGLGSEWQGVHLYGVANDRLLLAATTSHHGQELWRTDGTLAGTALVADILPGEDSGLSWWAFPDSATVSDNRLYFLADDGDHGIELWSSDGSATGTRITRDIAPGPDGSQGGTVLQSLPSPMGGGILFFALENLDWSPWRSDGSEGGTTKISTLDSQASSFRQLFDFRLGAFGIAGNDLFLITNFSSPIDPTYRSRLRITNASSAGTRLIEGIPDSPVGFPFTLPWTGRHIYFSTYGEENDLWVSDGSEDGTYSVGHLFPGLEPGSNTNVTPFLGKAIVADLSGAWRSDATTAGTEDLPPLTAAGKGQASGGTLFLPAESNSTGWELWAIDGAEGLPRLVKDILPGSEGSRPGPLAAVPLSWRPLAYFFAEDSEHGRELWVTDTSTEGAHLVMDLRPGPEGSALKSTQDRWNFEIRLLVTLGEKAIFVADDGVHGAEIFASDGSASGTVLLGDLYPGPRGSEPRWLTEVGTHVFFVAEGQESGRELWRTDGTPQGTVLVRDIDPGVDSSLPRYLVAARDHLFFNASDGIHGSELWISDGTEAGTRMQSDINPGRGASSPIWLAEGESHLFFISNDGVRGVEVWSLALDGVFGDGFESGDTTSWSSSIPAR